MREIKFRNIYRRHFDAHIWVLEYPIGILEDERSQLRSMANNELWELIATVQFTGLLDKNGVEIYEGDIIESGGYKRQIRYSKYSAGFVAATLNDFNTYCDFPQPAIGRTGCIVIGNIYENRNLLNGY